MEKTNIPAGTEEKDEPLTSERYLGKNLYGFLTGIAAFTLFTLRFFKDAIKPPYEFNQFFKQCFQIGNKSLPLVSITGFIMGLVFTMQSRPTLAKFGAQSWLPAMVAVAMVREIAPVITGLICAGKVGSGIGAELASMRVTEQIDAMEVSGNRPFKYLVVTRVLAATLMLPLLTILSDIISIAGSFIAVNLNGSTSLTLFLSHVFSSLDFSDVFPAIIKTFFFGFGIGIISCYKGYNSNRGTEGVGIAANTSVVLASLVIFIIDMIAVQLTNLFL